MKTLLRNIAIGGSSLGIVAVMLEEAMFNSHNHETLWRLDSPLPWVCAAPFLIVAVVYWFKSDEDNNIQTC